MRVRIVLCPEESWIKASECDHWSEACPRAKKAKKNKHKFVRAEPGYSVAITIFSWAESIFLEEGGWLYDYDPPDHEDLSEKRYTGGWQSTNEDVAHGWFTTGSKWIPAQQSHLFSCDLCDLKVVEWAPNDT